MSTFMQYASVAAEEALNSAMWHPETLEQQEATVRAQDVHNESR